MAHTISIIITCYNRELFIADAIDSALAQGYENKEVIVVDDGSDDRSWAVISAYGNRVIAIKQDNIGVSAARNNGVSVASGDYIVFLDSDDRLEPGALGLYADASSSSMTTILIGKCRHIDKHGTLVRSDMYRLPRHLAFSPLRDLQIIGAWASNCACLIPKKLLSGIGGYDTRLSLGEDYDVNLRLLDVGAVFLPIEKVTYQVRIHDGPKLTRNVSRERYDGVCRLFRRAWLSRKAVFVLPENREVRVQFARWVWSTGRTCYRAGFRETGDNFIGLAVEIAGPQARNGSAVVRAAYSFVAPHLVEGLVELVKLPTTYLSRLKDVLR
jgi:glycosyltransferase involved in cell wall biosynthesis